MMLLTAIFVVAMSVPYLVPHLGVFSLFSLVPLLCMDYIGTNAGVKRMWLWHYSAFVLWNAVTTFWVCNATIGGGIFACLANALQMSLIFGTFRWSKKVLKGSLPYILLAVLWIAWERYYLVNAQISWPWLLMGNAFARTVSLVQWYEFTGALGGSLWVWACNLSIFGLMVCLAEGSWLRFNVKAKSAAILGVVLLFCAPITLSLMMYHSQSEPSRESMEVAVLQPNIDPYNKFGGMSRGQQNAILIDLLDNALSQRNDTSKMILAIAPETFTGDIINGRLEQSQTWRRFVSYLQDHPNVNLLFGASSYDMIESHSAPSYTARPAGPSMWVESHNSALMIDGTKSTQTYHKSKLVVGVESTPYPAVFCKIDDMLGGVIGRCVGQEEVSLLNCIGRDTLGMAVQTIPTGCAVCYESVYPEHCAEYVRKGARMLTVITNDAWWGNTPGYRQHLSYASLRAIETRRWIARSANTGISAIIDDKGNILQKTDWEEKCAFLSNVYLNDCQTFFVRNGDFVGRICTMLAGLLLLAAIVRRVKAKSNNN